MVEVEVIGITLIPDRKMGSAVLLKEKDGPRIMPIIIGIPEARAITLVRRNLKLMRPLTHDLLHNMLRAFKVRLDRLEITELKDGIFFGRMILFDTEGKLLKQVDCRPSDGIVMALKSDAPILVDDEVFEEAYQPELEIPEIRKSDLFEAEKPVEQGGPIKGLSGLDVLKRQIEKAIEREDYEEAARIRDRIKMLEKGISEDENN